MSTANHKPSFTATRNACKLCAPLGACLALRGVEGAVPFLHGSQGCATYIRRYMISHFKEPLDIASSNFGEAAAIFGGRENLRVGLANVIRQYHPSLIGIATTCLAETIGDDVKLHLHNIEEQLTDLELPPLVHVSTPSYRGTHAEGFHATVRAIVETLAQGGPAERTVNLLPGISSPADLRALADMVLDFGIPPILLPDYSDTLDGPAWTEYRHIPEGGTPVEMIRHMGRARATLEFGATWDADETAGAFLAQRFSVPRVELPPPVGVRATDRLIASLEQLSGRTTPERYVKQRGRLVDSFVDAHKYVFGKRAVVYGEQDLVVGLVSLLAEVGVVPALCGSGARTGRFRDRLVSVAPDVADDMTVLEGADFAQMEETAAAIKPDLLIGSSKGYSLSRRLGVPLVRVGFPIHDRIDGPRLLHVGYAGAQQLFDRIANALIESSQDGSPVGYSYM